MDVRNNAEELRRFMLDLENWEDEMKRKEMELKKDAGKQPVSTSGIKLVCYFSSSL